SDGSDATFATAKLPPGVSAGYASFVNSSSANLSATVNPNGKATTFVVQYGPTTAYGAQTSTGSAGAGTRSTGVHATLTGLSAATVYHYRLGAARARGRGLRDERRGPHPRLAAARGFPSRGREYLAARRAAQRRRQPAGPHDDVVLRARPDRLLRAADAATDDLGAWPACRGRRCERPSVRSPVPLPSRRLQRQRTLRRS